VLRQWFVVHRSDKAPLPATREFAQFLVGDGARLIAEQMR
jgi:hypothetical protein